MVSRPKVLLTPLQRILDTTTFQVSAANRAVFQREKSNSKDKLGLVHSPPCLLHHLLCGQELRQTNFGSKLVTNILSVNHFGIGKHFTLRRARTLFRPQGTMQARLAKPAAEPDNVAHGCSMVMQARKSFYFDLGCFLLQNQPRSNQYNKHLNTCSVRRHGVEYVASYLEAACNYVPRSKAI